MQESCLTKFTDFSKWFSKKAGIFISSNFGYSDSTEELMQNHKKIADIVLREVEPEKYYLQQKGTDIY